MTIRTLFRLFSIFSLAFVVLLAACGGDDDDSDGGDGAGVTVTSDGDDDGDEPEPTDEGSDGGDGDDDGSGGSEDFQACSLFTVEEISEITGIEMEDGVEGSATVPDGTQCTWEPADGTTAVYVEVVLEDGASWFETLHSVDGEEGFAEATAVPGIGDEAVWDDGVSVLDVVEDDQFVSVQAVLFTETELEVAQEIATLALERLP
jgi:hypothetical protein